MNFANKWDAIAWMCRNQLGRRNLTDEQRAYLIGKQYEAQKMTQGTNNQYAQSKSEKDQSGLFHFASTAQRVAKDLGVGEMTVKRSEKFAHGLDAAEAVAPGAKEAVLSGKVSIPKSTVAEIRNLPDDEKKEAAEAIKAGVDSPALLLSHLLDRLSSTKIQLHYEKFNYFAPRYKTSGSRKPLIFNGLRHISKR